MQGLLRHSASIWSGLGGLPYPPFKSDLNTWHKIVSDLTYSESINNLPATFLPRVSYFNGTDDVALKNVANFLSASTSGSIKARAKVEDGKRLTIFGSADNASGSAYFRVIVYETRVPRIEVRAAAWNIVSGTTISAGWHDFEFISTGSAYVIKVDGLTHSLTVASGANDGKWFNYVSGRDNISIGSVMDSTPEYSHGGAIDYVKIDDGVNGYWICNGDTNYIYDISANANHLALQGTGTKYIYDLVTNYYPAKSGYSLWQKESSPDIQVPLNILGNAISLTPGTNIPTGYSKTRDITGKSDTWNMADSLVGFNETGVADTELEIFDRSNATRQTAASRASSYYDATSLATKSRYHISEIADPRIYFDFFNVDYAGKLFGKVTTVLNGSVYDIIEYIEQLNYATDKKNAAEHSVMKYCGIDVYEVLDEGNYTVDENGYIIIS